MNVKKLKNHKTINFVNLSILINLMIIGDDWIHKKSNKYHVISLNE